MVARVSDLVTNTLTPTPTDRDAGSEPTSFLRELIGRISRLEVAVVAAIAAILLVLVLIEPDILEAPFENGRTILFTVGGTVLAAAAFVAMLWLRVPSVIRVIVLVVPFVFVNWWLLSPYFVDDVVDEEFTTSISDQLAAPQEPAAAPSDPATGQQPATDTAPGEAQPESAQDGRSTSPADAAASAGQAATADESTADEPTADDVATPDEPVAEAPPAAEEPPAEEPPPPTGPVLLGAGQFVGLAGHDGTGDAGIFQNPDGSLTLRFENFDIENGPDLEVYLVPGADQVSLPDGSIHLGALKGNIGDQNYDLPAGTDLPPGPYTVLVWCEAFSVEFVGATVVV